jgi:hypothetical protein
MDEGKRRPCRTPGCTRARSPWMAYCPACTERILYPRCERCGSAAHRLCSLEPISELEARYMDGDR